MTKNYFTAFGVSIAVDIEKGQWYVAGGSMNHKNQRFNENTWQRLSGEQKQKLAGFLKELEKSLKEEKSIDAIIYPPGRFFGLRNAAAFIRDKYNDEDFSPLGALIMTTPPGKATKEAFRSVRALLHETEQVKEFHYIGDEYGDNRIGCNVICRYADYSNLPPVISVTFDTQKAGKEIRQIEIDTPEYQLPNWQLEGREIDAKKLKIGNALAQELYALLAKNPATRDPYSIMLQESPTGNEIKVMCGTSEDRLSFKDADAMFKHVCSDVKILQRRYEGQNLKEIFVSEPKKKHAKKSTPSELTLSDIIAKYFVTSGGHESGQGLLRELKKLSNPTQEKIAEAVQPYDIKLRGNPDYEGARADFLEAIRKILLPKERDR